MPARFAEQVRGPQLHLKCTPPVAKRAFPSGRLCPHTLWRPPPRRLPAAKRRRAPTRPPSLGAPPPPPPCRAGPPPRLNPVTLALRPAAAEARFWAAHAPVYAAADRWAHVHATINLYTVLHNVEFVEGRLLPHLLRFWVFAAAALSAGSRAALAAAPRRYHVVRGALALAQRVMRSGWVLVSFPGTHGIAVCPGCWQRQARRCRACWKRQARRCRACWQQQARRSCACWKQQARRSCTRHAALLLGLPARRGGRRAHALAKPAARPPPAAPRRALPLSSTPTRSPTAAPTGPLSWPASRGAGKMGRRCWKCSLRWPCSGWVRPRGLDAPSLLAMPHGMVRCDRMHTATAMSSSVPARAASCNSSHQPNQMPSANRGSSWHSTIARPRATFPLRRRCCTRACSRLHTAMRPCGR
mgnify:CR=1 FL=1